jgi:hypothetical protein
MARKAIDKMAVGEDLAMVWLARFIANEEGTEKKFLR